MVIKTISFEVHEVGKLMKKSKKRFIWKFSIDGVGYTVELYVSFYSGKKVVMLNGDEIFRIKKKLGHNFTFPFQIDVNMCNITQKGETFELKINNTTFDSIINDPNAKMNTYSHSHQSHKQMAPLEPGVSRTTKILLEMDAETNANKAGAGETRPDFQSALDKLKGVRPALEKQKAAEAPVTTNTNKNTNPPVQQKQQPQSTKNSKPATTNKNDPYDLWNIDFTQSTNTGTTTTQQSGWNNNTNNNTKNQNAFDNFNFNQQPANTNKNNNFNDFNNFGDFGNQQNTQNNNFNNFNNFGNTNTKNDEFYVPQKGKQQANAGNQDFFVPGSGAFQNNNNNGNGKQKEKEKEKEKEKSNKGGFFSSKPKEKKKEENMSSPPQHNQNQQQQSNYDTYNNNNNSYNNTYNNTHQNVPVQKPVEEKPATTTFPRNLSAIVGIDRSKLAGISGTTKKSRAAEEATASKNSLDDHQENNSNYANSGNGGYAQDSYEAWKNSQSNSNQNYNQNYY